MSNEQIIQAKVTEFVSSNKMFTSVDISNSIKKDGTWISNSEVAEFLKSNRPFSLYSMSSIPVMNNQRKANLYYPIGADPFDYLDRDQHALTPKEAGLVPAQISPTVTHTHLAQTNSTASSNTSSGKTCTITTKNGRLRIPAKIVSAVGMQPGNEVDYSKISMITGCQPAKKIFVHKDGRIFLPIANVSTTSKSAIDVYNDQNQIKFDDK